MLLIIIMVLSPKTYFHENKDWNSKYKQANPEEVAGPKTYFHENKDWNMAMENRHNEHESPKTYFHENKE